MATLDWVKIIGCTPEQSLGSLYAARPNWAGSYISHRDAQFLLRRILDSGPQVVVEIGTSTGVSTAIVCHALSLAAEAGIIDSEFQVRTYDILERFAADETRRIGDAAREMLPATLLTSIVFRDLVTAGAVREDFDPDSLDFVFIDADHRHPWPALDMLAILGSLRSGAEVVLHDINLPEHVPDDPHWGAKFLFDALEVEKLADDGDSVPNIGSVWVPADKEDLARQLRDVIHAREWEAEVPAEITASLTG